MLDEGKVVFFQLNFVVPSYFAEGTHRTALRKPSEGLCIRNRAIEDSRFLRGAEGHPLALYRKTGRTHRDVKFLSRKLLEHSIADLRFRREPIALVGLLHFQLERRGLGVAGGE